MVVGGPGTPRLAEARSESQIGARHPVQLQRLIFVRSGQRPLPIFVRGDNDAPGSGDEPPGSCNATDVGSHNA